MRYQVACHVAVRVFNPIVPGSILKNAEVSSGFSGSYPLAGVASVTLLPCPVNYSAEHYTKCPWQYRIA